MTLPKTDVEITQKLLDCNIRPSVQRLHIYGFLCRNPIHPTAETVYLALHPSIPTLSRTTVYNTMKLFVEHGLVQSLNIENEELRYDADTSEHLHFKCTNCGEVFDVKYSDTKKVYDIFTSQLDKGFSPKKIQTFIWGICCNCNK